MAKKLDKLKKEIYKQERLKGNSIAKSMISAGCKETTAYHDSTNSSLVKTCEKELMEQVKASEVSVEWVIEGLTSELLAKDCRASDRIRVRELIGKYLNMFKDNNLQQVNIDISGVLDKLNNPKPINIEPVDNLSSNSATASD